MDDLKRYMHYKLLLPILLAVLIGFFAFFLIYSFIQNKKAKDELQSEMDKLSELIVTANGTYVWNADTGGLQQSLDSFLKNDNIVSIEIINDYGDSMAKAA